MPRETSSISRTRTGCRTCRSRRIKCDEHHPVCRNCIKSGLACSYELRLIWREESLSRGVCHGRSGVWSKSSARPSSVQHRRQLQGQGSRSRNRFSSDKSGVSIKRSGRDERLMFLNTTIRDLELYFAFEDFDENEDDAQSGEFSATQPLNADIDVGTQALPDMGFRDLDTGPIALLLQPAFGNSLGVLKTLDYDSSLLSYYEAVVCSSSTLLDDPNNNPYRHLILPMAMQSEGIYHATLAVSAQILGIAEPKYRLAALEHGNMALKTLRKTLQRGTWSGSEIDEIVGLALMLCWFEITDGCRPSWVIHLNGIHSLMVRYPQFFKRRTSGLSRFFNRYFSFHVVLARTTFRVDDDLWFSNVSSDGVGSETSTSKQNRGYDDRENVSMLQPTDRDHDTPFSQSTELLSRTMSLEDLDQIDSYMGFSNSLLLLINEVADLAWKYPTKADVESNLFTVRSAVNRLRHSLENLRQTPPPLRSMEDNPSDEHIDKETQHEIYTRKVFEFETIAEANRTGALLFLYEICSSRFERPDIFENNATSSADTKSEYVRKILDIMVENINRIGRTAALPLWPLFLAGCCANSEEDRVVVMKIFEETEKPKRFGNITPAREVVEMIWRQRDLGVQDDRKRRQSAAFRRFEASNCQVSSAYQLPPLKYGLRRCAGMFEWERAMSMMGGIKLSLT